MRHTVTWFTFNICTSFHFLDLTFDEYSHMVNFSFPLDNICCGFIYKVFFLFISKYFYSFFKFIFSIFLNFYSSILRR